jgi:hypothetical protein
MPFLMSPDAVRIFFWFSLVKEIFPPISFLIAFAISVSALSVSIVTFFMVCALLVCALLVFSSCFFLNSSASVISTASVSCAESAAAFSPVFFGFFSLPFFPSSFSSVGLAFLFQFSVLDVEQLRPTLFVSQFSGFSGISVSIMFSSLAEIFSIVAISCVFSSCV